MALPAAALPAELREAGCVAALQEVATSAKVSDKVRQRAAMTAAMLAQADAQEVVADVT